MCVEEEGKNENEERERERVMLSAGNEKERERIKSEIKRKNKTKCEGKCSVGKRNKINCILRIFMRYLWVFICHKCNMTNSIYGNLFI